ncbi:MAG: LpxL/LpxP family Kdo(2)-lipid IV(A) lauroyl/palmitoleoyl acyltransferase [Pseudomonadota bacterium]
MLPPRYKPGTWPIWAGLGVLRLISMLPARLALGFGALLGRLATPLVPPQKKHIAETNLRLCFPELSREARKRLLRQHVRNMGISVMETCLAWWAPDDRLRSLGEIEGLEHLQAAMAEGKGVILLSAHFTMLEIGGHLVGLSAPTQVVYRRHQNPALEYVTRRGRERHAEKTMHRDDIRDMVRSLRAGRVVWFAPDQNYKHANKVFAPFFGIAAATNPAPSRLAAMTGARVVPFVTLRRRDGYRVRIQPALDNFPSEDLQADTARINAIFEDWAREQPADYYWLHRRFKTRPAGEPPIYS